MKDVFFAPAPEETLASLALYDPWLHMFARNRRAAARGRLLRDRRQQRSRRGCSFRSRSSERLRDPRPGGDTASGKGFQPSGRDDPRNPYPDNAPVKRGSGVSTADAGIWTHLASQGWAEAKLATFRRIEWSIDRRPWRRSNTQHLFRLLDGAHAPAYGLRGRSPSRTEAPTDTTRVSIPGRMDWPPRASTTANPLDIIEAQMGLTHSRRT